MIVRERMLECLLSLTSGLLLFHVFVCTLVSVCEAYLHKNERSTGTVRVWTVPVPRGVAHGHDLKDFVSCLAVLDTESSLNSSSL